MSANPARRDPPPRRTSQRRGQPPIILVVTPELKQDLQQLHDWALQHPKGPETRLLQVALNELQQIAKGARSTHRLSDMASYPALSDCETTYVQADPNRRPSHRIVWRELPPTSPGQPVTREVIAFGERDHGRVYHVTGQRLGRPVGFTLDELRVLPEPIAETPSVASRAASIASRAHGGPRLPPTTASWPRIASSAPVTAPTSTDSGPEYG